ncbi:hypothetical protein [Nocardioides sp. GXZ039]|uniref:hypothetical protein n=1 Tax=Nocardioides sp. GXZ039 TaxID=3136018 RepID=UPI0030F37BE4
MRDRADDAATGLAQRLLDAQVAYHLARLDDVEVTEALGRHLAEHASAAVWEIQVGDLLEPFDAEAAAGLAGDHVGPLRDALSALAEVVLDVVADDPDEPYPIGELVDRERVEAVVDAALGLTPVLERALARLEDSVIAGTLASRFTSRIVGEVVAANRAVADRVPGLGSLMSFGMSVGSSAASRVKGAADRQLEGLLGDAAGRGGRLAVQALNRILLEMLRDPSTRAAVLEAWDRMAVRELRGVDLRERSSSAEVSDLVDALHDLVVDVASAEGTAEFLDRLGRTVRDRYGEYTLAEVAEEIGLERGCPRRAGCRARLAPPALVDPAASGVG